MPWGRGDGGHIYDVPRTLLCDGTTQNCNKSLISSEACNLPGRSGRSPIVNGNIYTLGIGQNPLFSAPLLPLGWITADGSSDGLTFTNRTTVAHPLSGTVARTYDITANGSIFVTTVGRGDAFLPTDTLNEALGPTFFRIVNAVCAGVLGR